MARIRWVESEWLTVVANALPLIAGGTALVPALLKSQQRALSKERRHKEKTLLSYLSPSRRHVLDAKIAAVQALPEPARAALMVDTPAPAPRSTLPKAPPPDAPPRSTRWTTREWAIVATGVELVRKETAFADASLPALYFEAQQRALPEDRRRALSGLQQSQYVRELTTKHEQGLKHAWQYAECKDPFAATRVEVEPAPAPVVEPLTLAPAGVPVAAGASGSVMSFAAELMQSLQRFLVAHEAEAEQRVLAAVTARVDTIGASLHEHLGPVVQQLLQVQLSHFAPQVEDAVRRVLIAEIGGTPAPAPAPGDSDLVVSAPNGIIANGSHVRITVLGNVEPEWQARIKDAATAGVDLHVVPFDQAHALSPHRGDRLIVMQNGTKLPRDLQRKLRTVQVLPIVVRAAGGHVLRAVQDAVASASGGTLQ